MSDHRISIAFRTDWTIGTGKQSDAFIDQSVKTDANGLPIVPAEYFFGLWRDACEQVASAFDAGCASSPWSTAVERLFGDEGHGGLLTAADDARLIWAGYLLSDHELASMYRERLIVHRHNTAVDDARGVAKHKSLRVSEAVRAGTALTLNVTLADWPNRPWQVDVLLASGLRNMHHLAGKRRRGGGRVKIVADDPWAFDRLIAKHAQALTERSAETGDDLGRASWPERPLTAAIIGESTASSSPAASPRWVHRLTYRVTLTQPALASRRVVGNTIESHDYLPGAYLLGAIAGAVGAPIAPLIRDARFCVTPAHPDLGGFSAQAPKSWVSEDKGRAWRHGNDVDDAFTTASTTAKGVRGWETAGAVGAPTLALVGHPRIDGEAQRPLDDGMFVVQELSEGQSFVGEIWDDSSLAAHLPGLKRLNGKHIRLGRGKKKRGGAVLQVWEPGAVPVSDATIAAGETVRLRALTDVVLLDDLFHPRPTAAELVKQLSDELDIRLTLLDARLGVVRTESWSVAHGRPRASTIGIAAGSVVLISPTTDLSRDALDQTLAAGIGELRVEGFGRLGVLGATPKLRMHCEDNPATSRPGAALEPSDPEWVELRAAIWQDELVDRVAAPAAIGLVKSLFPEGLTPGQLRSLRAAALQSLRKERIHELDMWVQRAGATSAHATLQGPALDQFAADLLGTGCPTDRGGLSASRVVAAAMVAYCRDVHRSGKVS